VACGNTGPMHLAAAVGTPVAAVFAPTVPAERWRPWRAPHVLLGDQDVACAGCRARDCPIAGQPCLAPVGPDAVVAAVAELAPSRPATPPPPPPPPPVLHRSATGLRWAPEPVTHEPTTHTEEVR